LAHGGSVAGDDEPWQTATPDFDGGARIDPTPRPSFARGVLGPFSSEDREPGRPVEYEIEDGTELFFPWLRGDD
jgi:hypothetical protein